MRPGHFQEVMWFTTARLKIAGARNQWDSFLECSYLVAIAVSFMYARKENMDSFFIPVVEEL